MRFLSAHFSSPSRSLWGAAQPPGPPNTPPSSVLPTNFWGCALSHHPLKFTWLHCTRNPARPLGHTVIGPQLDFELLITTPCTWQHIQFSVYITVHLSSLYFHHFVNEDVTSDTATTLRNSRWTISTAPHSFTERASCRHLPTPPTLPLLGLTHISQLTPHSPKRKNFSNLHGSLTTKIPTTVHPSQSQPVRSPCSTPAMSAVPPHLWSKQDVMPWHTDLQFLLFVPSLSHNIWKIVKS